MQRPQGLIGDGSHWHGIRRRAFTSRLKQENASVSNLVVVWRSIATEPGAHERAASLACKCALLCREPRYPLLLYSLPRFLALDAAFTIAWAKTQ